MRFVSMKNCYKSIVYINFVVNLQQINRNVAKNTKKTCESLIQWLIIHATFLMKLLFIGKVRELSHQAIDEVSKTNRRNI